MILIIGLGNPGKRYEKTRHNIGFQVVDESARKNNFSDFKLLKKFNAKISKGMLNGQKIILAKPQAFMNNSGKAVKNLTIHYSLPTINLIVVHDDIDLPLGKIRIVKSRGGAGHKGVQSIINELGTKNFVRFRIGIKPKTYPPLKSKALDRFVLKKFTKDEEKIVKGVIKKTVEAFEFVLKNGGGGLEKAMNKFNK